MKAIQVKNAGGPEVLNLVYLPKPKIKTGWTLVKVKGFGINRSEIFTRRGYSPSVVFPRVLGIECVGIVEETSDTLKFQVGQKVISIMGEMGRDYDGSYAEYVLVPNNSLYAIDSNLSWQLLAALPETFYTAYGSLKQLRISQNDTVLVRAGSSGVGIAFLCLMKALFPEVPVYASVRNEKKCEELKRLGFKDVFIEKNGKVMTHLTFSKMLDLVGPKTISDSILLMTTGGIVCSSGQLGGQWFLRDFDPIDALKNNIYLTTFYSGNVNQASIQELFTIISKNNVHIPEPKVFKLEEIQDAHYYLENGESIGKAIVLLGE